MILWDFPDSIVPMPAMLLSDHSITPRELCQVFSQLDKVETCQPSARDPPGEDLHQCVWDGCRQTSSIARTRSGCLVVCCGQAPSPTCCEQRRPRPLGCCRSKPRATREPLSEARTAASVSCQISLMSRRSLYHGIAIRQEKNGPFRPCTWTHAAHKLQGPRGTPVLRPRRPSTTPCARSG